MVRDFRPRTTPALAAGAFPTPLAGCFWMWYNTRHMNRRGLSNYTPPQAGGVRATDAAECAAPRVSVLIPVYRTNPAFLREAIQSVLAQTYSDFELVLLDDCPDDPREDVVREFNDPRIRYARNERNLGISSSRNRLIDMARGEYLAIFDHDDVSHPTRLEKEVAYLDAHPECGVVSSWVREIPGGKIASNPIEDGEIKARFIGACSLVHSACMVRASVLEEAGVRYEQRYSPCEDYALFMKLIPHTRFHNIDEALLDYRWHGGNTTETQSEKMIAADTLVRRWAERNLPDLYDEFLVHSSLVRRVKVFGGPTILKVW